MKVGEKKTDAENGKETANFCQSINYAIRNARRADVYCFEVKIDESEAKIRILQTAKKIFRISSKFNFRSDPVFVPNCIVVMQLNQVKNL